MAGRLKVDLSRQKSIRHPAYLEPIPRTSAEAKARLTIYLKRESDRLSNLREVLQQNGILLDDSSESFSSAMHFFHSCCMISPWLEDGPEDVFIEFTWNLAQYVGNLVISRSPPKPRINKWTVERVSLPWDQKKFEFSVCGYARSSDSFCPNLFFLNLARSIYLESISADEFRDHVIGRINFILQLTEKRCSAELAKSGQLASVIKSRYL